MAREIAERRGGVDHARCMEIHARLERELKDAVRSGRVLRHQVGELNDMLQERDRLIARLRTGAGDLLTPLPSPSLCRPSRDLTGGGHVIPPPFRPRRDLIGYIEGPGDRG